MSGEALGIIEVVGLAAAIEAADSCVKAANVELIGYEVTKGGGLVIIKIRGNVGAVKAALEAAKVKARKVNEVYATLIIPRPANNLERMIESSSTEGIKESKSELKESSEENSTVDIKEDIEIGVKEDAELKEHSEENSTVDIKEDIQIGIKGDIELKENSEGSSTVDIKDDIEMGIKEDTELKEKNLEVIKILNSSEYYKSDQEDENKVNNDNDHEEESVNSSIFLNEDESDDICNICQDSKCQRRKGQPRNLCIHYKRA